MKGGNDSFRGYSPASPPLSEENVFLIFFNPRILLLPRREPNLARG